MSNILDRLNNLEKERSSVLRTAEMVPSRSLRSSKKKKSRKRFLFTFFAIIVSALALAYHFKQYLLPQYPVAVATSIDLASIQNQKNDLAVVDYQNGDFKKAAETLEGLVKAYPDRVEFRMNLAMAYQQLAKFDQAHEQLKFATTLEPNNSYLHNNLGLLALRTKEEKLAEKSFTRAFELNPKSPEIVFNLGSFYEKSHQLAKSVETYQSYISLPDADKVKIELLKKRIPRLSSLSARGLAEEEEGS